MENMVPIEKNSDYILDIVGIASEGEGVGKIEGFTVFVAGALKGERVKVKIVKLSKNHAYGKLLEIIEISHERVEPLCSIYKRCGGCNIQHMSYAAQLQFKKEKVIGCLTRIGKLEVSENNEENKTRVGNTIGMTTPYRYRNKVQLPIGEEHGEPVVGFYAPRSHEIIKMDHCLIQEEVADEIVHILKQWIKKNKIQVYNEMNNQGILRHIMIRKAFKTGEVMVVIVTNGNYLPNREEFIQVMKDNIPGIKSIIHNINSKNTNLVLGEKCITLWGSDTISDYIGEFRFNISPLSFFQVNPIQTEVLYAKALEFAALTGEETVFDAYCGTGTISLFLSQKAKKVYGIEVVPEAIENAKLNAAENNVDNVEFLVGQCEQIIPQLIKRGKRADVVVVDPPRKGCEKSLLEAIASISPDRIVYVSCDPGTLARDLGILKQLGYEAKEVQPVDMFPQTGHVECVVLIEKK